jgi:hypothetical protein
VRASGWRPPRGRLACSSAARGGAMVFDRRRMQLPLPLILRRSRRTVAPSPGSSTPCAARHAAPGRRDRRRTPRWSSSQDGAADEGRTSSTGGSRLRRPIEPEALAIAAAPHNTVPRAGAEKDISGYEWMRTMLLLEKKMSRELKTFGLDCATSPSRFL